MQFRRDVTLKRRATGSYDQLTDVGFYKTTGSDTETTIKASVQPMSGSDMKLLPENRREEETLKIYTDTEIFSARKGNSTNADIISIDSIDYEVVNVFPWRNGVINHYKAFLSKRTTNNSVPSQ